MNGMTLWLQPGEKKKKDFGIRHMEDESPSMLGDRQMSEEQIKRFEQMRAQRPRGLSIIENDVTLQPALKENGPAGKVHPSDGRYVGEFKIPLRTNDYTPFAFEQLSGEIMTVGIEISPPSFMGDRRSASAAMGSRGRMGGRGGGRSGGMSGRGGGGGMGAPGGMQRMSKAEVWINVNLTEETAR